MVTTRELIYVTSEYTFYKYAQASQPHPSNSGCGVERFSHVECIYLTWQTPVQYTAPSAVAHVRQRKIGPHRRYSRFNTRHSTFNATMIFIQ